MFGAFDAPTQKAINISRAHIHADVHNAFYGVSLRTCLCLINIILSSDPIHFYRSRKMPIKSHTHSRKHVQVHCGCYAVLVLYNLFGAKTFLHVLFHACAWNRTRMNFLENKALKNIKYNRVFVPWHCETHEA